MGHAPSTFRPVEVRNLLECLGWGAIVGFAVGLARLLFRSRWLASIVGKLVSPGLRAAAKSGIVSLLLHVVAGAISGGVIGFAGPDLASAVP